MGVFEVSQSWAHWILDDEGFTLPDRGTPSTWDIVTLRVHRTGAIEFEWPEGASPFMHGPDEARFLANRMAEAALLSELCKQGWAIGTVPA